MGYVVYALCAWASYAFIPWPYGILGTLCIVGAALATKGDLDELRFLLVGLPIIIIGALLVICFPVILLWVLAVTKP